MAAGNAISGGATTAAQTYAEVSGLIQVGTGNLIVYQIYVTPAAVEAGSSLERDLDLPADARIESALFEVVAEGIVSSAKVASVAQVRPSTPTSTTFTAAATVDFGRLVTVGGIVEPGTAVFNDLRIAQVLRWTGRQWALVANSPSFTEVATERLLLQSSETGDGSQALADRVRQHAGIVLPGVPSSMELLVDGRTVWFERQGSAPAQVEQPLTVAPPGVRHVVDRTDAVREAFARAAAAAPAGTATLTVRVAMRVASPGRLALRPQVRALRVHTQDFPPEGRTRTFELPDEGIVSVEVTPPSAAAVHEVALTVRGQFGPERVLPPAGPPISAAARLVLAVGRSILIGLPRGLVSRFGTLGGVRMHLAAPGSGGQVTGRLLAAAAPGHPGEPVEGGELVAVTVVDTQPRWYTLPFTRPVEVSPAETGDVAAWLELQPGYGEIECALTGNSTADVQEPGAELRRRLSGGATGALTAIPALGALYAAVRLSGLPDRDHPVAAVSLGVAGTPDVLDVNPAAEDLAAALTLATPVPGTPPVLLAVTCRAAGSLVLDTVRVTYREEETP